MEKNRFGGSYPQEYCFTREWVSDWPLYLCKAQCFHPVHFGQLRYCKSFESQRSPLCDVRTLRVYSETVQMNFLNLSEHDVLKECCFTSDTNYVETSSETRVRRE